MSAYREVRKDAWTAIHARAEIFETTLRRIALEDPTAEWSGKLAREALLNAPKIIEEDT